MAYSSEASAMKKKSWKTLRPGPKSDDPEKSQLKMITKGL